MATYVGVIGMLLELFEITFVLVFFNHVAIRIVNADHGIE